MNEKLDKMKEKHHDLVISIAELTITDNNIFNHINEQHSMINMLKNKAICQIKLHDSLKIANKTPTKEVKDRVDGLVGMARHVKEDYDTEKRLDGSAIEIQNIFRDFLQTDVNHWLVIQC